MIPAIVLAAGKSTRMGRVKALLPLEHDETFLTRIITTLKAADVEDVVVVVGHDAPAIIAAFDRRPVTARVVVNPNYEAGQLTSLVAGLRVVDRPGVVAALVALVDAPFFQPATVRALVDRYRRTSARIVRPVHGTAWPPGVDRPFAVRCVEARGSRTGNQTSRPCARVNRR